MKTKIHNTIRESILVKEKILTNEALLNTLEQVVAEMVKVFENEGKILFCGNGGSAADAQHIAAELSGRFYLNRPPLFAEALHVNTSFVTAVANDYSYDEVYARAVQGMGRKGDILVAISTSGNSPNILNAIEAAHLKAMTVVGLTGESGGKMATNVHYLLNVPSSDTPRVQEAHILLGHILCELIEKQLFGHNK